MSDNKKLPEPKYKAPTIMDILPAIAKDYKAAYEARKTPAPPSIYDFIPNYFDRAEILQFIEDCGGIREVRKLLLAPPHNENELLSVCITELVKRVESGSIKDTALLDLFKEAVKLKRWGNMDPETTAQTTNLTVDIGDFLSRSKKIIDGESE